MRFIGSARIDGTEILMRAVGVTLAAGSLAFAAQKLTAPHAEPQFAGVEHLAIYAKPASHVGAAPRPAPSPAIDYTPVGSTHGGAGDSMLRAYEVLEASREAALIRLPEGRILRVSPGSRIAGLGAVMSIRSSAQKWMIVTQGGVIRQN